MRMLTNQSFLKIMETQILIIPRLIAFLVTNYSDKPIIVYGSSIEPNSQKEFSSDTGFFVGEFFNVDNREIEIRFHKEALIKDCVFQYSKWETIIFKSDKYEYDTVFPFVKLKQA